MLATSKRKIFLDLAFVFKIYKFFCILPYSKITKFKIITSKLSKFICILIFTILSVVNFNIILKRLSLLYVGINSNANTWVSRYGCLVIVELIQQLTLITILIFSWNSCEKIQTIIRYIQKTDISLNPTYSKSYLKFFTISFYLFYFIKCMLMENSYKIQDAKLKVANFTWISEIIILTQEHFIVFICYEIYTRYSKMDTILTNIFINNGKFNVNTLTLLQNSYKFLSLAQNQLNRSISMFLVFDLGQMFIHNVTATLFLEYSIRTKDLDVVSRLTLLCLCVCGFSRLIFLNCACGSVTSKVSIMCFILMGYLNFRF
jgi:hypothetical protein